MSSISGASLTGVTAAAAAVVAERTGSSGDYGAVA
jgi:hypothetical protein